MVEILRNSLAITTISNRHKYQHHTFGPTSLKGRIPFQYVHCFAYVSLKRKTNRLRNRISGLRMVSMSEGCHNWFGPARPRMPKRDILFRSIGTDDRHIVSYSDGSVEFQSPCVQIEEEREDEEFTANSLEQKIPPWGNVVSQQDSSIQSDRVVEQTSRGSKSTMTLNGNNRLHFLEERNEEQLSERILRLSRSNKVRSALEFYRSMEFSGLRPNLHAYNSLLSCFLRNGMLDDALSIFEFMKAKGTITGHTYSLILKAIANSQGCDAALDLFEELEGENNHKKDFDAVVYNTMISVCGKLDNWVQTERIWRNLKDNGHIGTEVTYRLLVCIFVRCGQNELALDAYQEMIQNKLKPDNDAMQAIIGANTKEGNWDLALSVFQNMLNSGLKPNIIACNALINSLGKAGKLKLAFRVYGLMKSLGHAPDSYTWNALLSALYRANQHADAVRLFESIQRRQKFALNLHLYNTTLMSYQRLGLWDRALKLLWQMEASGLHVSTVSYNIVIRACEAARRPKVALQVYEHMVHQKLTPDTFTLLSLMRGCIWGSLWDEVEEILNWVVPNGSLYNAAIQGMCLRGKIDLAKKLYVKMRGIGLKPDGKTRALMLQNLPKKSVRRGSR